MDINLELYKVFYTVSKYKSMTKAANELAVSQPAISKSIQTLEEQLGGTVFLRSNKGLELTEEGKMLYDKISPALAMIYNAENEFGQFKNLETGLIKIGVSTVLTKTIMLDAIEKFRSEYPNIKINITNGLTSDLILLLNQGKLDFVIFNEGNVDEKTVSLESLTKLKYKFFYNPKYFDANITKVKQLLDFPVILQKKESNTRKYLDYNLVKYNIFIEPAMEVVSQDLVCEFASIGLGIGFAFEKLLDRNYQHLTKIDFRDDFYTDVFIATNKSISPTFASKQFISELKNTIL